ncbi:MAG: NAD(+) diphosphatase [Treponema sp.]|uniref:NAD(+) diphosphatase n=1 Tax=Treponema sp. TaxID=166 RepID=UPI003FA2B7C5
MPLLTCIDGSQFSFGILIQKKNIFVYDNGSLPTGATVTKILSSYDSQNILVRYSEDVYQTFAALLAPEAAVPEGLMPIPYRSLFVSGSVEYAAVTARAALLLNWLHTNCFCASCGAPLFLSRTETAQECSQCRRIFFPVIAPCIIVLISKGDKILLARHLQHTTNIYTCIAGFIEAGESAEDAVIREVREEVGLTITDIRYRGSQGWPYPNQLMLAFRAEYVSGEIRVQKNELSEAAWFSRDDLPSIPLPGSAAYQLICGDWY